MPQNSIQTSEYTLHLCGTSITVKKSLLNQCEAYTSLDLYDKPSGRMEEYNHFWRSSQRPAADSFF